VGCGVATPLVPLHAETAGTGTTAFANFVATFRSQAAGRDATLQFSDGTNQAAISMLSGALSFGTAGANTRYNIDGTGISTWSVAGTTAMTLNSTGLGIGGTVITTNFEAIATSSGSIGGTATVSNIAAPAIGNAASFILRTNSNFRSAGYASARIEAVTPAANNNTDLVFYNYKGVTNSGDETMRITSGGNVGVGGTPTVRLDVQNASGDVQARIKSGTANSTLAFDYVNNYGSIVIRKSATDVWLSGVIGDSGATPNYKIQNGSGVGVQLVSGATAWTALSDETVKDIIEPIGNAVAKVGSLRSVIGKFKTDSEGTRRSFLIAQDVLAVLPEAVDVVGEKNELGVRYTDVIPLLVAAIKELTARVQTLEAR
jgi:hypothetical protein